MSLNKHPVIASARVSTRGAGKEQGERKGEDPQAGRLKSCLVNICEDHQCKVDQQRNSAHTILQVSILSFGHHKTTGIGRPCFNISSSYCEAFVIDALQTDKEDILHSDSQAFISELRTSLRNYGKAPAR